jgi:hypothetical protein
MVCITKQLKFTDEVFNLNELELKGSMKDTKKYLYKGSLSYLHIVLQPLLHIILELRDA